jgi:queuine tRNA-ribosyltransferase
VEASCERTYRWLLRCKAETNRLNAERGTAQQLFGINQGATFADLRIEHMKKIAELDLLGYAIGGLAVGETHEEMYETIEIVQEHMPKDKPRYLMGVGTPQNIIESVARGIDMFDCVMPSRNGRHGHLFTWNGILNINNAKHAESSGPVDADCHCPLCSRYSRAYLRHLFKSKEILGMRLAVLHNLYFYNELMAKIRIALDAEQFGPFRSEFSERLAMHI